MLHRRSENAEILRRWAWGAHEKVRGLVLLIGFTHSMYIIDGVTSALAGYARNFASLTTIGTYDNSAEAFELPILHE